MYDSPINLFTYVNTMAEQINEKTENAVLQEVHRLGIDIDKETLISVICQDRKRYDDAYQKGYNDAQQKIIRCKDCKYGYCINPSQSDEDKIFECMKYPIANLRLTHNPDYYCAEGANKNDNI